MKDAKYQYMVPVFYEIYQVTGEHGGPWASCRIACVVKIMLFTEL